MQVNELAGMDPGLRGKYLRLLERLRGLDSLVVAFSGGVDSGLLAAAAHQALGAKMLAVTIHSPVETDEAVEAARLTAVAAGFAHKVVEYNDLENPQFVQNPADRCYHCKLARLGELRKLGQALGFDTLAEGSNADDGGEYRPGKRAVAELGILSPLAEAGLAKAEVRALARVLGLPIWNRPSAPCLATRFPYGTTITVEGIRQVALAEAYLRQKGFEPVRVRHYGQLARIEVAPEAIARLIDEREAAAAYFKELGFTHTAVDLAGYRSGSLNEGLALE
jgi:uncharacterized protein